MGIRITIEILQYDNQFEQRDLFELREFSCKKPKTRSLKSGHSNKTKQNFTQVQVPMGMMKENKLMRLIFSSNLCVF